MLARNPTPPAVPGRWVTRDQRGGKIASLPARQPNLHASAKRRSGAIASPRVAPPGLPLAISPIRNRGDECSSSPASGSDRARFLRPCHKVPIVILGLVPGIHRTTGSARCRSMDPRDKPEDDSGECDRNESSHQPWHQDEHYVPAGAAGSECPVSPLVQPSFPK